MRKYLTRALDGFRRASLPTKISSLLGVASFFVSIKAGIALCSISAGIAIYDAVVGAKRRRLRLVLNAINSAELKKKIAQLDLDQRSNGQGAAQRQDFPDTRSFPADR